MISVKETISARRVDQLRFNMFIETGDEPTFYCYLANEGRKLNQRQGSERIAKVMPLSAEGSYPDASGNGIPQWEIIVPKRFFCIAVVSPGQKCMAGGYPISRNPDR